MSVFLKCQKFTFFKHTFEVKEIGLRSVLTGFLGIGIFYIINKIIENVFYAFSFNLKNNLTKTRLRNPA